MVDLMYFPYSSKHLNTSKRKRGTRKEKGE
jgi:hypothetical protein